MMGISHYTTGTSTGSRAGSMGDWNRVTDRAIGAHTDAGKQCTDTIEAGVRADGPACILHMGTRSGGFGWAKSGTRIDTYVMPDWASSMTSHE